MPDGAHDVVLRQQGALFGYALAVVLLVLDAVGAVLWFRGSGFAYNERFMQVSNGGFARETISFPRKKIQFGYTKTNPFNAMPAPLRSTRALQQGLEALPSGLSMPERMMPVRGLLGSSPTEM